MVSWYRATLTERNAVETAGRVRVGTSSAPIRSVNAATLTEREGVHGFAKATESRSVNVSALDETRELTSPRVSSSAAPTSPPSPRSTP